MGRTGQAGIHAVLDDFITKLKRRQFPDSSVALARHTTETLIHAVAAQQAPTVEGIIEGVRAVSQKLVDARPLELVVGNMCRRVLHIIREEAERDPCGTDRAGSSDPGDTSLDPDYSNMKRFKSEVIESVGELIDELESTAQVINQQALEHVSPGSVVFTAGGETCVENFLREANRKRSFQVIVSESEPGGPGHALARVLADKGVDVTLIAESATFAVMPRVHLVVLSARGVFADGAALCPAGHNAVAVAAKAHRVPVIVLAGTHELSPLGPDDPEYDTDELLNPAEAYAYEKMGASAAAGTPAFSIANPAFDRVAPDLISLFVTDAGGQVPGFVASLLAEFYSPEDRRFEG